MKTAYQLFFLSVFVKEFICLFKEEDTNKFHLNNFIDHSPDIIIAVNKPHTNNYSTISENNMNTTIENKNKLENIVDNVEELLQNIEDTKNKLLENRNGRNNTNYGLNIETEIINANDENVLNLLLNKKNNETEKKRKISSPLILVFPQNLTYQELMDYEKYKDLMKDVKIMKNLLLKVVYFEKLSNIKSKNKKEATKEIENTKKIIEKSISRRSIIDEILEEIYDEYKNEDINIEKLKSESAFLKEKINVLNEKIRKLGYIM